MTPNLNKWKYIKLHRKKRIINLGKGNKGKDLSIYNDGIIVVKSLLITQNQLEAVRKFINKKLKGRDKKNYKNKKITAKKKKKKKIKEKTVIMRKNINLGLTKKPLQVRMGKGKGSPVDWVYPMAKNRVLLEYLVKQVKLKKLQRIFKYTKAKLPAKIKFRRRKNLNKKKKFNLLKIKEKDENRDDN